MAGTLFDRVKLALRIRNSAFDDDEVQPIIDACKMDLKLSNVNKAEDDDPLIQRAVILYAKGMFGYSEDSEKFMKAYEFQKASLSVSPDYNMKGGG
ncbi:MAG: head-tail connector protein [Clostridium sp.]|uniref:head-tail connector protein n=1 Tax=Clostridium sp. TaxID=1506 RepID=UPI0029123B82|nr:head-tail connector protein [Clostridium sp.]MDU7339039.1 head-tail connector protein [Clostridium sp.]